jgi:thiol-disulfide isomerase/thioredoxin
MSALVKKMNFQGGGSTSSLLLLFYAAWLTLFPSFALANSKSAVHILYFFSSSCPHCIEVQPYVKELSREFHIDGFLAGKGDVKGLPFPVQKGAKEIALQYGIKGVPAMVVLADGVVKLKISGARDIKDIHVILKAFQSGAMTASEALDKVPQTEFILTGWVAHRGPYFDTNAPFVITDRQNDLTVDVWLPIEVVKSPFKKSGPRMMSDVMNKPVVLRGKLIKTDRGRRFRVSEEMKLE